MRIAQVNGLENSNRVDHLDGPVGDNRGYYKYEFCIKIERYNSYYTLNNIKPTSKTVADRSHYLINDEEITILGEIDV